MSKQKVRTANVSITICENSDDSGYGLIVHGGNTIALVDTQLVSHVQESSRDKNITSITLFNLSFDSAPRGYTGTGSSLISSLAKVLLK
jgi:hypothetical protein